MEYNITRISDKLEANSLIWQQKHQTDYEVSKLAVLLTSILHRN
jgi:DNA-binding MarR family transcriptional regulator